MAGILRRVIGADRATPPGTVKIPPRSTSAPGDPETGDDGFFKRAPVDGSPSRTEGLGLSVPGSGLPPGSPIAKSSTPWRDFRDACELWLKNPTLDKCLRFYEEAAALTTSETDIPTNARQWFASLSLKQNDLQAAPLDLQTRLFIAELYNIRLQSHRFLAALAHILEQREHEGGPTGSFDETNREVELLVRTIVGKILSLHARWINEDSEAFNLYVSGIKSGASSASNSISTSLSTSTSHSTNDMARNTLSKIGRDVRGDTAFQKSKETGTPLPPSSVHLLLGFLDQPPPFLPKENLTIPSIHHAIENERKNMNKALRHALSAVSRLCDDLAGDSELVGEDRYPGDSALVSRASAAPVSVHDFRAILATHSQRGYVLLQLLKHTQLGAVIEFFEPLQDSLHLLTFLVGSNFGSNTPLPSSRVTENDARCLCPGFARVLSSFINLFPPMRTAALPTREKSIAATLRDDAMRLLLTAASHYATLLSSTPGSPVTLATAASAPAPAPAASTTNPTFEPKMLEPLDRELMIEALDLFFDVGSYQADGVTHPAGHTNARSHPHTQNHTLTHPISSTLLSVLERAANSFRGSLLAEIEKWADGRSKAPTQGQGEAQGQCGLTAECPKADASLVPAICRGLSAVYSSREGPCPYRDRIVDVFVSQMVSFGEASLITQESEISSVALSSGHTAAANDSADGGQRPLNDSHDSFWQAEKARATDDQRKLRASADSFSLRNRSGSLNGDRGHIFAALTSMEWKNREAVIVSLAQLLQRAAVTPNGRDTDDSILSFLSHIASTYTSLKLGLSPSPETRPHAVANYRDIVVQSWLLLSPKAFVTSTSLGSFLDFLPQRELAFIKRVTDLVWRPLAEGCRPRFESQAHEILRTRAQDRGLDATTLLQSPYETCMRTAFGGNDRVKGVGEAGDGGEGEEQMGLNVITKDEAMRVIFLRCWLFGSELRERVLADLLQPDLLLRASPLSPLSSKSASGQFGIAGERAPNWPLHIVSFLYRMSFSLSSTDLGKTANVPPCSWSDDDIQFFHRILLLLFALFAFAPPQESEVRCTVVQVKFAGGVGLGAGNAGGGHDDNGFSLCELVVRATASLLSNARPYNTPSTSPSPNLSPNESTRHRDTLALAFQTFYVWSSASRTIPPLDKLAALRHETDETRAPMARGRNDRRRVRHTPVSFWENLHFDKFLLLNDNAVNFLGEIVSCLCTDSEPQPLVTKSSTLSSLAPPSPPSPLSSIGSHFIITLLGQALVFLECVEVTPSAEIGEVFAAQELTMFSLGVAALSSHLPSARLGRILTAANNYQKSAVRNSGLNSLLSRCGTTTTSQSFNENACSAALSEHLRLKLERATEGATGLSTPGAIGLLGTGAIGLGQGIGQGIGQALSSASILAGGPLLQRLLFAVAVEDLQVFVVQTFVARRAPIFAGLLQTVAVTNVYRPGPGQALDERGPEGSEDRRAGRRGEEREERGRRGRRVSNENENESDEDRGLRGIDLGHRKSRDDKSEALLRLLEKIDWKLDRVLGAPHQTLDLAGPSIKAQGCAVSGEAASATEWQESLKDVIRNWTESRGGNRVEGEEGGDGREGMKEQTVIIIGSLLKRIADLEAEVASLSSSEAKGSQRKGLSREGVEASETQGLQSELPPATMPIMKEDEAELSRPLIERPTAPLPSAAADASMKLVEAAVDNWESIIGIATRQHHEPLANAQSLPSHWDHDRGALERGAQEHRFEEHPSQDPSLPPPSLAPPSLREAELISRMDSVVAEGRKSARDLALRDTLSGQPFGSFPPEMRHAEIGPRTERPDVIHSGDPRTHELHPLRSGVGLGAAYAELGDPQKCSSQSGEVQSGGQRYGEEEMGDAQAGMEVSNNGNVIEEIGEVLDGVLDETQRTLSNREDVEIVDDGGVAVDDRGEDIADQGVDIAIASHVWQTSPVPTFHAPTSMPPPSLMLAETPRQVVEENVTVDETTGSIEPMAEPVCSTLASPGEMTPALEWRQPIPPETRSLLPSLAAPNFPPPSPFLAPYTPNFQPSLPPPPPPQPPASFATPANFAPPTNFVSPTGCAQPTSCALHDSNEFQLNDPALQFLWET